MLFSAYGMMDPNNTCLGNCPFPQKREENPNPIPCILISGFPDLTHGSAFGEAVGSCSVSLQNSREWETPLTSREALFLLKNTQSSVPLLLYLLNSVCPSRASQHTPSTERR
jgi:hypothetical protein